MQDSAFTLKSSPQARFLIYAIMWMGTIAVLLPLVWLLSTSLKTQIDLTSNVWGPPRTLAIENYINAWTKSNMGMYVKNSFYVVIITVIITLIGSTTISFALSRINFATNRLIYYIVISGMFIPIQAIIIPLYINASKLNLQNNLTALAFIYAASRIPISVFILESYMQTIPMEIEQSATIDGCGPYRLFTDIMIPLSKDGIIMVIILSLLACWNELIVALVMIGKPLLKTLPIGMMQFVSEFNIQYTQLCAALLLSCIPNILFYALLQEKIIKGMTMGAIKG